MAPDDTGAVSLADRFPELAAKLVPGPMVGSVVVRPTSLPAVFCAAICVRALGDGLRASGFMLPSAGGSAVETLDPEYKVREDAALCPAYHHALDVAVVSALPWCAGYHADRALVSFYGVGGHFSWHRDDMLPEVANRHTAISIALNDPSEYEGGALELPEAGLSIRPPLGALVAFPASALHRVTPVTAGVRKVLLTFILKGNPS